MRKFKISWDEEVDKDVEVEFTKWAPVFYSGDNKPCLCGAAYDTRDEAIDLWHMATNYVGVMPIKVKHTVTEKVIERKEKILYDPNGRGCSYDCNELDGCTNCIYEEGAILCVTKHCTTNIKVEEITN